MRLVKSIKVGLCALCFTIFARASDVSLTDLVVNQLQSGETLSIFNLPGLSTIEFPEQVKNLIASVAFSDIKLTSSGEGFSFATVTDIRGIQLDLDVYVEPSTTQDTKTVVSLAFPDQVKVSDFIPSLENLDLFSSVDMKLILSNYDYVDPVSKQLIKKGANISGSIYLEGPLRYLSHMIGQGLQQVDIVGLLVPGIIGSSLKAFLPGRIQFIGGVSAQDLELAIKINDRTTSFRLPACCLEGTVTVDWPGQEPLLFMSSIDLCVNKACLYGSMNGTIKNILGIYGVHAGSWALGGVVNYAALGIGIIPFSEFMMHFDLMFGSRTVHMASKVGLGALGISDLAFEGKLEGGFSIADCIDLAGSVIEQNPSLDKTAEDYKAAIDSCIPAFAIGDVYLFFSPKDVEIDYIPYTKGLIVDGTARLFGSDVQVFVDIKDSGVKVIGYLEELDLGPVKITGPGYDRIMDTPDDGLILDAELTLEQQYCYMGAVIDIDILGGIYTETTIDVSAKGIQFEAERKLFGLFDFGLLFTAQFDLDLKPVDFYVKGHMHQTALTALQNILSKAARSIAIKKLFELRQAKFSFSGLVSTVYDGFWSVLASLVGNTFNIKEFTFESHLDELVGNAKLPQVTIKGTVLGKDFELNDILFDLEDVMGSVTQVVDILSGLF